MAKGAYQIGALQAIREIFKPSDFRYVSSASIGALNSYAFLANNLDMAIDIWKAEDKGRQRKWVTSLLKSTFLHDVVKQIICDIQLCSIFYVPLVDIKKRKLVYVDIGKMTPENIELHLRASISIPIFNPAIDINGDKFYDGAIIDNIPIMPILKNPVDYIICIYFDNYDYIFENECTDKKIIKINFSDNIITNSICYNSELIYYMIDEGYAKAKKILDYVLFDGVDNITSVYSRISTLHTQSEVKNPRVTGDIIVNNMNKVVRKFMRKIEVV